MATAPAKPGLMSVDEFFDFASRPENQARRIELVRGKMIEVSPAGMRHNYICANVIQILGEYAARHRDAFVCGTDTGLIVEREPDTVRAPDIAYFTGRSRHNVGFGDHPPVLAVEVLSPSDSINETLVKVLAYIEFGVPLVWVVDPDKRTVAVHEHGGKTRLLQAADRLSGGKALEGFECLVEDLFLTPAERAQKRSGVSTQ